MSQIKRSLLLLLISVVIALSALAIYRVSANEGEGADPAIAAGMNRYEAEALLRESGFEVGFDDKSQALYALRRGRGSGLGIAKSRKVVCKIEGGRIVSVIFDNAFTGP